MEHSYQHRSGWSRGKGPGEAKSSVWAILAALIASTACTSQKTSSLPIIEPVSNSAYSSRKDPGGEAPPASPSALKADSAESPSGPGKVEQGPGSGLVSCSEGSCRSFNKAADALQAVIAERQPRLVSFGEAHAPADFMGNSTVSLFTTQLLPAIAHHSSFLTVEILAPPREGCAEAKEKAQQHSDQITTGQRASNQNEYAELGFAARKLGILPDILRADCATLERIAQSEDGVLVYMESISQLFIRELSTALERAPENRPVVLSYGGALHNDAEPRFERASWSFAPAMIERTNGLYLEIDLILPELIGDSETWRAFPWYPAYEEIRRELPHAQSKSWLIPWGEHSAAIIFPVQ